MGESGGYVEVVVKRTVMGLGVCIRVPGGCRMFGRDKNSAPAGLMCA